MHPVLTPNWHWTNEKCMWKWLMKNVASELGFANLVFTSLSSSSRVTKVTYVKTCIVSPITDAYIMFLRSASIHPSPPPLKILAAVMFPDHFPLNVIMTLLHAHLPCQANWKSWLVDDQLNSHTGLPLTAHDTWHKKTSMVTQIGLDWIQLQGILSKQKQTSKCCSPK